MKEPSNQHWYNKIRQRFLLSFFDDENRYEEKIINGFYLIKQFNRNVLDWEVAIYTEDSYRKKLKHKEKVRNLLIPRGNKQERG